LRALEDYEAGFHIFLRSFTIDGTPTYRNVFRGLAVSASRSVEIDFEHLASYDRELSFKILENPDEYLKILDRAAWRVLENEDPKYAGLVKSLHVRFRGLSKRCMLHDIGPRDIGKLLMIGGLVTGSTYAKLLLIKGAYRCRKCSVMCYVMQEGTLMRAPGFCAQCGSKVFEFLEGLSTYVDFQEISIKELPEELYPGQLPKTMNVSLLDDLVDVCQPGQAVFVTAVVRARQKLTTRRKNPSDFELYLDANCVTLIGTTKTRLSGM
jgi:replicative DNA helicase Mcm